MADAAAETRTAERVVAPLTLGPGTLVTARSYLIDRMVPDCEIVALPAKEVAGGTLSSTLGPGRCAGRARRRRWPLGAAPAPVRAEGVAFDMRHHDPSNWAHVLTNHLPLLFRLAADWDLAPAELTPILPGDAPEHARAALRLFGLEPLATDGAVEGTVLDYRMDPWTGLRPARADWVRETAPAPQPGTSAPLPERVFLARRDTRAVANMAEVEALLGPLGFVTTYPEDLPAADQVRLFRDAREIVAVHGAGLAPLLYRPAGSRLERLVEILPCGHMTDVYRVMAQQVGCAWIGVRGRLKPGYVDPAYDLGAGFTRFSLDAFEVDPEALRRAYEWSGT